MGKADEAASAAEQTSRLKRKLERAEAGGDKKRVHELEKRLAKRQKVLAATATKAAATKSAAASQAKPAVLAVAPAAASMKAPVLEAKAAVPGSSSDEDESEEDETAHETLMRAEDAARDQKAAATASNPAALAPAPSAAGNVSLLLFYCYVKPPWGPRQRAAALEFNKSTLAANGCSGRLRVALEGLNATLTGPPAGVRAYCAALRASDAASFGATDFKIVDGLAANKSFKGLKVFPVDALVTYGFDPASAPLTAGGTHLTPEDFTAAMREPGTVLIDVRNANETAIGRFAPPPGGAEPLDPRMRRSTEFPAWVDAHMPKLAAATKVLMCCTAGIRCERASALLGAKGLQSRVYQLEGGIHRYLDAYPVDGGLWAGKNYVFDKRFSHGAETAAVVGACACCGGPWERYQAQAKCAACRMECLLCRACERGGRAATTRLLCWLCAEAGRLGTAAAAADAGRARAFAAAGGGRDGEGEGAGAKGADEEGGGSGGRGQGRGGRRGGQGRA